MRIYIDPRVNGSFRAGLPLGLTSRRVPRTAQCAAEAAVARPEVRRGQGRLSLTGTPRVWVTALVVNPRVDSGCALGTGQPTANPRTPAAKPATATRSARHRLVWPREMRFIARAAAFGAGSGQGGSSNGSGKAGSSSLS